MTRLGLLVIAALALASCGRQGDLARPGPMFGSGRNIPAQTATGPASSADPDGDASEGTQADQPGSTGAGNTGIRNPPSGMDPSRSRDPASSNPIDGTSNPIGDRPSVTPR